MNAKRLCLCLFTAMVVLSPLAALKPTSAESITIANPKATLIAQGGGVPAAEIPIDLLEIGKTIDEAVKSAENRDGFVVAMMEAAVIEAKKRGYNVMVFNLSQSYKTDIRNTAEFFKLIEYDGIPYGVWIFDKGTFTNEGDGGSINWAFYGDFERDGMTVKFR